MKIMIRLFAVFLMIFCFAGCNNDNVSNQSNDISKSSVAKYVENNVTPQKGNTEDQSKGSNILLSVLYNEEPFITINGITVYLKDYRALYKLPEGIDYYEKDNVFIPRDYTFVDLDKDGNKELIVAEAPYADTYLILRKENETIYGYSLYTRWFQSLKQDGSFISSGGALINDYNTITFNKNIYNISTIAKFHFEANNEKLSTDKYYFEPDYEKSVFEINGKQVPFEAIKQFAEEWDKRPEAEWIKFEQPN